MTEQEGKKILAEAKDIFENAKSYYKESSGGIRHDAEKSMQEAYGQIGRDAKGSVFTLQKEIL